MPQPTSLTVVAAAAVADEDEPPRTEAKLPALALGGWNLRWGSWEIQGWDRVGAHDAVLRLRMVSDHARVASIPCTLDDIRRLEGDLVQAVDEQFELTLTVTPAG